MVHISIIINKLTKKNRLCIVGSKRTPPRASSVNNSTYPYAISTQVQLPRSPSTSYGLQLSGLDTVPSSPRRSGELESGLAVGSGYNNKCFI